MNNIYSSGITLETTHHFCCCISIKKRNT